MNPYPSSPTSQSSASVDESHLNTKESPDPAAKYEFYSDRPAEIDYDPPPFDPPSHDELHQDDDEEEEENDDNDHSELSFEDDEDEEEEQTEQQQDDRYNNNNKDEEELSDETTPNMYQLKIDPNQPPNHNRHHYQHLYPNHRQYDYYNDYQQYQSKDRRTDKRNRRPPSTDNLPVTPSHTSSSSSDDVRNLGTNDPPKSYHATSHDSRSGGSKQDVRGYSNNSPSRTSSNRSSNRSKNGGRYKNEARKYKKSNKPRHQNQYDSQRNHRYNKQQQQNQHHYRDSNNNAHFGSNGTKRKHKDRSYQQQQQSHSTAAGYHHHNDQQYEYNENAGNANSNYYHDERQRDDTYDDNYYDDGQYEHYDDGNNNNDYHPSYNYNQQNESHDNNNHDIHPSYNYNQQNATHHADDNNDYHPSYNYNQQNDRNDDIYPHDHDINDNNLKQQNYDNHGHNHKDHDDHNTFIDTSDAFWPCNICQFHNAENCDFCVMCHKGEKPNNHLFIPSKQTTHTPSKKATRRDPPPPNQQQCDYSPYQPTQEQMEYDVIAENDHILSNDRHAEQDEDIMVALQNAVQQKPLPNIAEYLQPMQPKQEKPRKLKSKKKQSNKSKKSSKTTALHKKAIDMDLSEIDPSSMNDNGKLEGDNANMLKLVTRIEKRQIKVDKHSNQVEENMNKLQNQKHKILKQLEFDKKVINDAFEAIEKRINEQFDAHKQALDTDLKYLDTKSKTLDKIHAKAQQNIFSKSGDLKAIKKECTKEIEDCKKTMKKMNIIQPNLRYESFLAKRHAVYQDIVDDVKPLKALFENQYPNLHEMKQNEDKMVFMEGCLSGVVPVLPDQVDVTITKSFTEKEVKEQKQESEEVHDSDIPSDDSTVLTLATNAKYHVEKRVRVMLQYNNDTKWFGKFQNVLQHEIVIELKNTKPHRIIIDDPTVTEYEWPPAQDLRVYEGVVKVRSRNDNGWSQYKKQRFKYDEDGNQI